MKNLTAFLCSVLFAVIAIGCANAQPTPTATKTGVGAIQLGMQTSEIPTSYSGLYDAVRTTTIEEEDMGDIYTYDELQFTLNGELVMTATPYDGIIYSIKVVGANVKTAKGVGVGTSVADMFKKGAKTEIFNDGNLYFMLDGIYFEVAGYDYYTESGDKKIQDGYSYGTNPVMTATDFKSDAKMGSIVYIE